MPYVAPRRAVSTATTVTVNSNVLPSWVPGPGEYADASLFTPAQTSGVNPCPTNTCPYSAVEGQSAIWEDWNGGAFSTSLGTYGSMLLHGGGHYGYFGNEVLRYDLETRAFSRLNNPSNYGWGKDGWATNTSAPTDVVNSYGSFPDGAPNPLHTYCNFEYVPSDAGGGTSGSLIFMHRGNSNSTVTDPRYWKFDIATLTWTNGPTAIKANMAAGTNRVALIYDSKRKGIWNISSFEYSSSNGISFYSLLTGQQYDVPLNSGNSFSLGVIYQAAGAYNATRDCLVLHRAFGGFGLACIDLSSFVLGTSTFATAFQITQSGTPHPNIASNFPQPLEWCPYDGNFYAINWPNDARLYKLTVPATLTNAWVWSSEMLTPKSGTSSLAFQSRSLDNNLFTRFRYVPALKSFMWSDRISLKAQLGRPAAFV